MNDKKYSWTYTYNHNADTWSAEQHKEAEPTADQHQAAWDETKALMARLAALPIPKK